MERLDTYVFNDTTIEHLHRYAFALSFVQNKIVIDIASGEGYGSNLLASYAAKVYGIDIANEVVQAAAKKYKKDNLQYLNGGADKINLPDNFADVVVSFETIEHHDQHEDMMQEVKRVLKHDGILIISTPDKKYYTDIRNTHNPWHIKELYRDQLKELVSKYFLNTVICAQNITRASIIVPEILYDMAPQLCDGDYNKLSIDATIDPLYNIVVASNAPLPPINFSLFNGNEIDAKNMAMQRELQAQRFINSYSYRIGYFILTPLRWLKIKRKYK